MSTTSEDEAEQVEDPIPSVPEVQVPEMTMEDELRTWLSRNRIKSCKEIQAELNDMGSGADAKGHWSEAEKADYIRQYRNTLRDVCKEYANARRRSKTAKELAVTMAVASSVINIVKSSFLQTIHSITSREEEQDGDFTFCMHQVAGSPECDQLWRLEKEISARLDAQNKAWGFAKVLEIAKRGKDMIMDVLTESGIVKTILGGATTMANKAVPYALKAIMFILHSPKMAMMGFMYVKYMKRNLCNRLAHWIHLRDIQLPPETTLQSLGTHMKDMAGVAGDVLSNTSASGLYSVLGSACRAALNDSGGLLTAAAKGAVNSIPVVGGALGGITEHVIATSMAGAAEALAEAAEFAAHQKAVENSFGQFLEMINPQDCLVAYREARTKRLKIIADQG